MGNYEEEKFAFAKAVRASELQVSLLVKFFRWATDNKTKELIESVDGGFNKRVWQLDTQVRSEQAFRRENLRTHSSFIMSSLFLIQSEGWRDEALAGDLSLMVNTNRPLHNGDIYSATYAMCTYSKETPSQCNEWFGSLLKYWRGSLDTLRVNRILAGKSGTTSMHKEVDRFLRSLEKTHLTIGLKKTPINKKPRARKS